MDINQIITDYFIKPIISPETQGYNLVNTTVYIALLVIACAVIYKILSKKVVFDSKFFTSIIPYILFGISMRVIMHQIEAGLLVIPLISKTASPLEFGFWFFTPGIWILTFALVTIGLLIGEVWKKLKLERVFWFGVLVTATPLLFNLSRFNNWLWFIATAVLIIAISYIVCYAINKFTKYKIFSDKTNYFIVLGQAIDGIASATAIAFFGFSEQHVVSNFVINIHPALFAAIKILLAVLICWSLDDYLKEQIEKLSKNPEKLKERKNIIGFVKVIIAILGFATGLASLFKLGLI